MIWACFLARGVFYTLTVPIWENFDEYAHFARVQQVAEGRLLAGPGERATRYVERSIELVPMPWTVRAEAPPRETHESYWQLPAGERARRERELASLPASLAHEDAREDVPNEWQQPPLAYWLMAPVYLMLAGFGLPVSLTGLRLLNLLITSAVVPAAFIAARSIWREKSGVPVAVAALAALVPEVMFDGVRISNSGLTIALFSALAALCMSVEDGRPRSALWAGVATGLGLLTKAFFLMAVPVLAAVLIRAVRKRTAGWRSAAGSLALALGIPGWWYIRNLLLTGSISTSVQDDALRHLSLAEKLRRVPEVNWLSALDSTFLSHIWFGGWSFLQVRAWMYHLFAWVALAATLGLILAFRRNKAARPYLASMAGFYLLFCAGISYHVLLTFLANGVSSSAGWYLCSVTVPEILLAVAGLRAIVPERFEPLVPGALAAAFALLELYAMFFVALPYWAGLIGHRPGGSLAAFHLSQLRGLGLWGLLSRLSVNKPGVASPATVAVSGLLYFAAAVALVAVAIRPSLFSERPGGRRRLRETGHNEPSHPA